VIRDASRDLEAVRLIALHRFLTRPQLEELLFAGATLTPRSRQVLAWRILGRLQRDGYVRGTPRQAGGASGGSILPAYFLTASGLRLAAAACPDLPNHRPARRAAFLAPHSALTTEIELALRRAARAEPEQQEVELWEADWQIAMRLGDGAVIPDARVEYRVGGWRNYLFIEADLGTEGTRFFERKMGRYVELYESSRWREFLRVWPRILTVTLTEARAASLHRATEAFLTSRYPHSATRLGWYFVSIDALRGAGVGALCHAVNKKDRQPVLDVVEITSRETPAAPTTSSADADTVLGGRSGAGRREDDDTPRITSQVDGLA
jgi:hypothetical protein